jgi:hypothetical protein
VNKCAGSLRSIASSVNLPPHIKPDAYILTNENILKSETDLLATLGKCTKITIIEKDEQAPKGCGVSNLGLTKIFL